jgi:hypothetical protein
MDSLTFFTCIALGTSFVIACNQLSKFNSFNSVASNSPTNFQLKDSPNSNTPDVSLRVNLLPYELLDRQANSYADISLILSNYSEREIKIEVIHLEIVGASSRRVLMSRTPQELQVSSKTSLKPGETRTLEYRLHSASKVYQEGQDVFARIRYRQSEQPERVVQSNPEAVAFMIP